MRSKLFSLYIFIISNVALAEEHAASGGHEIPFKLIGYQSINVIIMIGAMIYFLKDVVRKFFSEKKEAYMAAAKRAEMARKQAEQERSEVEIKLSKLQSTADESLQLARAEAAQLKQQLMSEAEALSKRIRDEAAITAKLEIEKAKNHLRETLIKDALDQSKKQLEDKITAADKSRLYQDFSKNVQAVQK